MHVLFYHFVSIHHFTGSPGINSPPITVTNHSATDAPINITKIESRPIQPSCMSISCPHKCPLGYNLDKNQCPTCNCKGKLFNTSYTNDFFLPGFMHWAHIKGFKIKMYFSFWRLFISRQTLQNRMKYRVVWHSVAFHLGLHCLPKILFQYT